MGPYLTIKRNCFNNGGGLYLPHHDSGLVELYAIIPQLYILNLLNMLTLMFFTDNEI